MSDEPKTSGQHTYRVINRVRVKLKSTFQPVQILAVKTAYSMANHTCIVLAVATIFTSATQNVRGQMSDQPLDAAKPFLSELWQLEYRQQDENNKDGKATSSKNELEKSNVNSPIISPLISDEEELDQLRVNTAVDEWEIAASLANEDQKGVFRDEATAWQLSQTRSPNGDVATAMNQGPTLTTFLVGIVASIVMTGAIFSGRQ